MMQLRSLLNLQQNFNNVNVPQVFFEFKIYFQDDGTATILLWFVKQALYCRLINTPPWLQQKDK